MSAPTPVPAPFEGGVHAPSVEGAVGIAITVILIIILVIRILYRRRAYAGTVTPPMGSPVAPIAPGGTPVPAGPSPACPTCGRPLNFIGEYQSW